MNASNPSMEKAPRHMGIELLRIVATGMIVLHHLLAHGGCWLSFPAPGPRMRPWRLLNAFAYCAVNLYGLISGYGSSGRFRPARLVGLWVQAWFTGVVLTALLSPLTPVTAADWRTALLPIGSQEYWYLTAYFGLYVLSPALHAAVERLSPPSADVDAAGLRRPFHPDALRGGIAELSGGYHVGWLCVLYLLGAWLRRYGSPARSNWKPLLCFFLCVGIAGGWQIAALLLKARGITPLMDGDQLLHYNSPLMLLASLALFRWFLRLHPSGRLERFIRWAAPLTLGVYLIHDQPVFRRVFIVLRLTGFSSLPTLLIPPALLSVWLVVFAGSAALEWLRVRLFALCRVDRLCQRAGDRLTALAWPAFAGRKSPPLTHPAPWTTIRKEPACPSFLRKWRTAETQQGSIRKEDISHEYLPEIF